MKTYQILKDLTVCYDENYEWDYSVDLEFLEQALKYSGMAVGFYTNYFDINGVRRIQHSYDRVRLTDGEWPKFCYVIRTELLRHMQPDPECGDFQDLDFALRLTEIGPAVHIPLWCFRQIKEIKQEKDSVGFHKTLEKALRRANGQS